MKTKREGGGEPGASGTVKTVYRLQKRRNPDED